MSNQTIFKAALALPEDERIRLAGDLLESVGPETDGVDESAFLAELHCRSSEIDQRPADLIPWSELKNESF